MSFDGFLPKRRRKFSPCVTCVLTWCIGTPTRHGSLNDDGEFSWLARSAAILWNSRLLGQGSLKKQVFRSNEKYADFSSVLMQPCNPAQSFTWNTFVLEITSTIRPARELYFLELHHFKCTNTWRLELHVHSGFNSTYFNSAFWFYKFLDAHVSFHRFVRVNRGFQGVIERWGMEGGPASRGSTKFHRKMGSAAGAGRKILRGKRMPGVMGNRYRSQRSVQVSLCHLGYTSALHGIRRTVQDYPSATTWIIVRANHTSTVHTCSHKSRSVVISTRGSSHEMFFFLGGG